MAYLAGVTSVFTGATSAFLATGFFCSGVTTTGEVFDLTICLTCLSSSLRYNLSERLLVEGAGVECFLGSTDKEERSALVRLPGRTSGFFSAILGAVFTGTATVAGALTETFVGAETLVGAGALVGAASLEGTGFYSNFLGGVATFLSSSFF